MKILVLEDDFNKYQSIFGFLKGMNLLDVTHQASYHSGLKELIAHPYDLLLLDMTIPMFDATGYESQGRPMALGGLDVLSMLKRKKKLCNTIVVTQYENFDNMSLDNLKEKLEHDFSECYIGTVYYNTIQDKWKDDLARLIKECED